MDLLLIGYMILVPVWHDSSIGQLYIKGSIGYCLYRVIYMYSEMM